MKWLKATAVGLVIAFALSALLFPVLSKLPPVWGATLIGLDGQPATNRTVIVRSPASAATEGERALSTRTNERGRFRFPDAAVEGAARGRHPIVDGFEAVHTLRSTGGNPGRRYIYGAIAPTRFDVTDPEGRSTPLIVRYSPYEGEVVELRTDGESKLPIGAQFEIRVAAEDREIADVVRTVRSGAVHYRVKLAKARTAKHRRTSWSSPSPSSLSYGRRS